VRIHTAIVTTAAIVAVAVPAVAVAVPVVDGAASPEYHSVPTAVVTSFYPGMSAVSGRCMMTLIAGRISGFRCLGGTQSHVNGGRCALTAPGYLWEYSCPSDKAGSAAVWGGSGGAIPNGCRSIMESGYRWIYSCPRTAFDGR
jgi:hypothetical protein